MRVRRCEYCNAMFSAQLIGVMAILCRPCAMDCDNSYMKVYRYLRDKEAEGIPLNVTDVEQIAEGSEVPLIFVKALFADGRFDKRSTKAPSTSCKRCGASLKPTDRELCSLCSDNLSRAINQTKFGGEPNSMEDYSPTVKQPSSKREGDNRYGLGR